MEITVMKEGVCEANMFDSGSKSRTAPKSDNSVNAIEKKETDKCSHFSIRAYVAEVREKDWRICWPFSSPDENEQSKKESDMFPPLHVPDFRWWGCLNCLQKSDVNTSVDVVGPEFCPLTHYNMKVKVADVMSITRQDFLSSKNYSNIAVKDVCKAAKDSISSEMKVAQFTNGKFCKGEVTIKLNMENSGLIELVNPNSGSSEVNEVAKTSEQVEDIRQKPDLETLENGDVGSCIGFHTSKLNPLEFTGNDDDKEAHGFSSQILSSRRPQKFRLLTEILRRDLSGASAKISSSNRKTCIYGGKSKVTQTKVPYEHDGRGLDIPSRGQISVEEIVEKDTGGSNKKRKAVQIEDQEQRISDEDPVISKETGYTTKVASGTGSHSDGDSTIWSKDMNTTDVRRHSEGVKGKTNGRTDRTNELESLNGIPVEIVELLAKHRHERRRLEADNAKENKLFLSNTKNATYSKKSELCAFEDKKLSSYPLMEYVKLLKPRPYSSQLKQTCKDNGSKIKQLEEYHNRKGAFAYSFSPLNHSRGNQFSEAATSKNLGIQGSIWDEDKLVPGSHNISFQCLTSCTEGRIVSTPTRIKEPLSVPMMNAGGCPFRFESSQQSANLLQRRNGNFHVETFKKNAEQPCACTQKNIEKFSNLVGHQLLYSNETIPATQLLKLMDAGRSSKVSRNVENTVSANRPSFPQITHHEGFFSGQRDENWVRRSLVSHKMGNNRIKSRARKRWEISDSSTPTQTANCNFHRFEDGSRGLGQKNEPFPTNGVNAEFYPPLNSMIVPLKSHLIEGSIGKMCVDKKVGPVGLMKGSCGADICTLNRNPADFSIPEARNEFTIGGDDFKFRKLVSKWGRPRLRTMKLQALKESAQIYVP